MNMLPWPQIAIPAGVLVLVALLAVLLTRHRILKKVTYMLDALEDKETNFRFDEGGLGSRKINRTLNRIRTIFQKETADIREQEEYYGQMLDKAKTGIVVLIPKLVVAAALGLGVAYFFNDNFLGLSSVSIIGGITFCNMALYTGIMGEFGDESEQGAVGILFFTAGPAVTMIILGVSGLANIPVGTIIGSILPLVIGMVLGNLFPFIKNLLVPGANPAIAVIGFQLGASMSLSSFITGGISGILLGLITLFIVGPITFAFERLCGGNGKAAVACSTIAGTAMTTPVALAEVAPRYAELAPTAYAQIATAVIITAIMAPILTGWVDKKFCHGKEDLSPAGVEAIEEAVATDIDGE